MFTIAFAAGGVAHLLSGEERAPGAKGAQAS